MSCQTTQQSGRNATKTTSSAGIPKKSQRLWTKSSKKRQMNAAVKGGFAAMIRRLNPPYEQVYI